MAQLLLSVRSLRQRTNPTGSQGIYFIHPNTDWCIYSVDSITQNKKQIFDENQSRKCRIIFTTKFLTDCTKTGLLSLTSRTWAVSEISALRGGVSSVYANTRIPSVRGASS